MAATGQSVARVPVSPRPKPMPHVDRDGVSIHYAVWPAPHEGAETLLFIPGLSASTEAFPTLFAELAKQWRLVVIDPRGAGGSSNGLQRFRLPDVAADCIAVLDAEGVERAHVLGLSMGGMIAQELVLGWPERVDRLVLCCTSCGRKPGVRPSPRILSTLLGGIAAAGRGGPATPESIADAFGGILFAESAPMERRLAFFSRRTGRYRPTKRGVLSQLLAIRTFASFERLHTLQTPTLVIHGDADVLLPTENAMILADAIPNARLDILPGGHVFFFEVQDLFVDRVNAFLHTTDPLPA